MQIIYLGAIIGVIFAIFAYFKWFKTYDQFITAVPDSEVVTKNILKQYYSLDYSNLAVDTASFPADSFNTKATLLVQTMYNIPLISDGVTLGQNEKLYLYNPGPLALNVLFVTVIKHIDIDTLVWLSDLDDNATDHDFKNGVVKVGQVLEFRYDLTNTTEKLQRLVLQTADSTVNANIVIHFQNGSNHKYAHLGNIDGGNLYIDFI